MSQQTCLIVYDTVHKRPAITCLLCGMTSHSPDDVKNKYCGKCHIFHEDPHGDWT